MFGISESIVKALKEAYPAGTLGTVENVDDIGTIHVAWDTGNHLGIVYNEDECEIVTD